ncbi:MAG: SMP-30/gluconolactonase/LRE family protein [Deltaproteobacteria bacterium]|nr:SMP-30/gluconolactonase/LRE family protein [Deltaproteobacteria bacterium]
MKKKTTVLLEGLIFPEGPRWHDNKLWFSDMGAQQVMTVDLEGIVEKIVHVPNQPSGLGWLPDGRLLIVSMVDRKLLRLDPDGLTEVADLYNLASCHCNDMVVDNQGRAYIGNFGFELALSAPFKKAEIILVTPDGDARIVATEMAFPNGSVITPDGKTLIVGETYGSRLTAFDIEPDGSLSNRRVWAALENAVPDGICLDAESAIWVASPTSAEALRVKQGGEVTDRIKVATQAFACMLGGPDRQTLFVLTANNVPSEMPEEPSGRIETVRVDIPGVGLP